MNFDWNEITIEMAESAKQDFGLDVDIDSDNKVIRIKGDYKVCLAWQSKYHKF
jgi:hypothetical protein